MFADLWNRWNFFRLRLLSKIRGKPGVRARDIQDCYRLLLGRNPNRDEFEYYLERARRGQLNRELLVANFLQSSEFLQRYSEQWRLLEQPREIALPEFKLFAAPLDSPIVQELIRTQAYEPHVCEALRRRLLPGMYCVDVGANIGYLSLFAARLVGKSGKVLCFEPSQLNCALLHASANLNEFDNIEVYPFAAMDRSQALVYHGLDGNGAVSLLSGPASRLTNQSLAWAVPLDLLLLHQPRVDLIKLDIEGAEWPALKGLLNTIAKFKPRLIVEVNPQALRITSNVAAEELLASILDLDYQLAVLDRKTRSELPLEQPGAFAAHLERADSDHLDVLASPR